MSGTRKSRPITAFLMAGLVIAVFGSEFWRPASVHALRDIDEESINDSISVILMSTDTLSADKLPEPIDQIKVEYPRLAKQAGICGIFQLNVHVDSAGVVDTVQIVKAPDGAGPLGESAATAFYRTKYKPGIKNGKLVDHWLTYKVEFLFIR